VGRRSYWGITAAILLAGASLIALMYLVVPRFRSKPEKVDPEAYERARRERAIRVCEETRARVVRGAVIGATDVEGWVTELVLLRRAGAEPFTLPHDLAGVVEQRRVIWKQAPELLSVSPGNVDVADASLASAGQARRPGLRLTFDGGYVTSYFREEERPSWIRAAGALAKQLGATHGGLYARCATSSAHHLGAWFLGPAPDGAALALLYFMGAHADVPHVQRALLDPRDGGVVDLGFAFERLADATRKLDRSRLGMIIGPHGGTVGGVHGATFLSFPFRDADRAARASRDLARALEIAGAE
jgi:hypothetical protein